MPLWVAVIDRPLDRPGQGSNRPDGEWAAYIDTDRHALIRKALDQRRRWSRVGRQYRVLVGTLSSEAREPISYEEIPLSESDAYGITGLPPQR